MHSNFHTLAHKQIDSANPIITCVVIPSYRVTAHILGVIERIPESIQHILIVDDACPDHSGSFVQKKCSDARVSVIFHKKNKGVGGAVLTGFQEALRLNADVIIKIDGDGQMDPALAEKFSAPIIAGEADYVKGNRFFYLDNSETMPTVRKIGNLGLTFISRFSTGYYSISDPTNGYIAISGPLAANLPVDKISNRYFFETDLLFRINTLGASVIEIPHDSFYGEEVSNLSASKEIFNFFKKNISTYIKRIFYQYVLRDFNVGSILLFTGILLGAFGIFGTILAAFQSWSTGQPRSGGALAILEVQIILSAIFLVGFLNFDINREPKQTITSRLIKRNAKPLTQYEDDK